MRTRHSIVGSLAFAAMLAAGTNAQAGATLTLTGGTSRCISILTERDPAQPSQTRTTTRESPCTPTPTSPVAVNEGTAPSAGAAYETFVRLTYGFTYTDDGLPLAGPTVLDPQLSAVGNPPPRASFEAGILSVQVDAQPRYAPGGTGFYVEFDPAAAGSPTQDVIWGNGTGGNGYVVFGLNDHPDQISGTIVFDVGVHGYVPPNAGGITNIAVSASVAAVPEPATYALTLAGLAAVAVGARRRRRGAHGSARGCADRDAAVASRSVDRGRCSKRRVAPHRLGRLVIDDAQSRRFATRAA